MAQTPEQKTANFGDPRDWQEREIEKFNLRSAELIRRLRDGEPLTKSDAKEARRLSKSAGHKA